MASRRHLKDLLQEHQEPFRLKSYIFDRQCQIKRPRTDLQIKTQKPMSQNLKFPSNFCRKACFFSFHESPDPRKSPLFDFQSSNKSPGSVFPNIPARTAAILLEAAARIQKQSLGGPTTKMQNRGNAFGLFGSMLKKLTHRKKREVIGDGVRVSVKDILRWDPPVVHERFNGDVKSEKISAQGKLKEEQSAYETRSSCSCNGGLRSAVWSESNEETSLDCVCDLETSSSFESSGLDEFASQAMVGVDFSDYDRHSCESPFHFVLQTSPSPGRRAPNFSSPAASPSRRRTENKENYEVENLKKLQAEEEDEEEKEQCSPVSVLGTPFEDDVDDDDDGHMDDDDEEQSFHLKSSSAIERSAKHRLLQKLCGFEQVAGLDPVGLEQRMSEEEHDNDAYDLEEQECEIIEEETETKILVQRILQSNIDEFKRIPEDMTRLVFDLIAEEEKQESQEMVAKRVCRRLDSWREVESNTIDMMVEQDVRQEFRLWTRNQEEVQETALEIERAVLGYLIYELSEELVSF